MRLTPEEIEARRFRLAPNGYDCEAVDRFLAEITEALRNQPEVGAATTTNSVVSARRSPRCCGRRATAPVPSGPRPRAWPRRCGPGPSSRPPTSARRPSRSSTRPGWCWPTPRPRPRWSSAKPNARRPRRWPTAAPGARRRASSWSPRPSPRSRRSCGPSAAPSSACWPPAPTSNRPSTGSAATHEQAVLDLTGDEPHDRVEHEAAAEASSPPARPTRHRAPPAQRSAATWPTPRKARGIGRPAAAHGAGRGRPRRRALGGRPRRPERPRRLSPFGRRGHRFPTLQTS